MRQFEHLLRGADVKAEQHRAFYDEYLAVMDLSAEFYLQTIQVVFKEHQLPRGVWMSRDRKIDPSFIETALMTVEGELDDISGVGQTKARCARADPQHSRAPAMCTGNSPGSATTASSTEPSGASRSCPASAISSAPTTPDLPLPLEHSAKEEAMPAASSRAEG